MSQYNLSPDILDHINISSDIEFGWSTKSGVFRHTAIVLKFDGVPLFTIDYGPEGGYSGFFGSDLSTSNRSPGSSHVAVGGSAQVSAVVGAVLMPGSDLRVNGINVDPSRISAAINRIARFLINSSRRKQFVTDLVVELAQIPMGNYSVVRNNCRDFVERAIKVIKAAEIRYNDEDDSSSSVNEFYQVTSTTSNRRDLQQVRQQDGMVVGGIAVAAAALFGALFFAGTRSRRNNN